MLSDARGLAALVLAVGTACAIIAIAIGAAVHTGPISTEESTLLATVLGAAVGALAAQGVPRRHDDDEDDEPNRRPPPPIGPA